MRYDVELRVLTQKEPIVFNDCTYWFKGPFIVIHKDTSKYLYPANNITSVTIKEHGILR